MPNAMTDLSPQAVIQAIEENLLDSSASLGRTEEGVVFRGTDVTWIYTGFPALSRVLQARFAFEDAEDRIAEILGYFKQWDASVTWVVGPSSFPPRLGEYLHNHGFGSLEIWSGMALNLAHLPARIEPPDSLRIQVVSDTASLRTWATLSADAGTNGDAEAIASVFSPKNAGGDSRCRYYLGYRNGQPIARGMSFTRDQVVGLYWFATHPTCRDPGAAAAMVHRALEDAVAAGASIAVMPLRPSDENLGTQLGFKPYCQFHVYAWPPSPIRMPVC
jgi:hypothetical protein